MKNRTLIAMVVFSCVLNSQGQNYNFSKSKKNHSASVYSFSIDRNFRTLVANERLNSQDRIDFRDSISKPSIFISFGGNRIYPFSKNIYLDIGLLYLATGYHSIKEEKPEYYIGHPLNIFKTKNITKRKFLSIPIKFKYYFSKKKVKAFVSAGVSLDFFIFENSVEIGYLEDRSKIRDLDLSIVYFYPNQGDPDPPLIFSYVVEAGVEIPIKGDINLQIGPNFRRSIRSIYKDTWFYDEYIYSYGLNFGIIRTF